ncbi:MAG TPA: cupin domain-containing protein [Candidatus Limnocylindrales bacterium]|jgi:quercetin dioxygenase-like cupin family protein
MEIRRFGPGHRRADGPPGTRGVAGQVIHSDERAIVAELAFGRYGMVSPHTNPNTALFVVISGGGFVQVGSERSRVNHGEAVLWPPDVPHGAYTDGSEMRAIVIELLGGEGGRAGGERLLEGSGEEVGQRPATPAEGALERRQRLRDEYDAAEGEPW